MSFAQDFFQQMQALIVFIATNYTRTCFTILLKRTGFVLLIWWLHWRQWKVSETLCEDEFYFDREMREGFKHGIKNLLRCHLKLIILLKWRTDNFCADPLCSLVAWCYKTKQISVMYIGALKVFDYFSWNIGSSFVHTLFVEISVSNTVVQSRF